MVEKSPTLVLHGKFFNSLDKVQGIVDLFEFMERLQVIVDRN